METWDKLLVSSADLIRKLIARGKEGAAAANFLDIVFETYHLFTTAKLSSPELIAKQKKAFDAYFEEFREYYDALDTDLRDQWQKRVHDRMYDDKMVVFDGSIPFDAWLFS